MFQGSALPPHSALLHAPQLVRGGGWHRQQQASALFSASDETMQQMQQMRQPRAPGTVVTATGTALLATVAGLLVARRFRGLRVMRAVTVGEPLVGLVGGLLSSSCCAIQLLLNLVSVSCAGFAALDFFRVPFTCLTFGLLGWRRMSAYLAGGPLLTMQSLAIFITSLTLTLMPSMVRASNERSRTSNIGSGSLQKVQFSVQGMKCLGCASGFKRDLLQRDGVGDVVVEWESAERATVTVTGTATSSEHLSTQMKEICEARQYRLRAIGLHVRGGAQTSWTTATAAKSSALFVLSGLAEIGGGWLVWRHVREGASWMHGAAGALALALYGFIVTQQPPAAGEAFGRLDAAYGGVFIAMSFAWGRFVEGVHLDAGDKIGAALCLAGVVVIMGWRRS